jgi:hypothetical protein
MLVGVHVCVYVVSVCVDVCWCVYLVGVHVCVCLSVCVDVCGCVDPCSRVSVCAMPGNMTAHSSYSSVSVHACVNVLSGTFWFCVVYRSCGPADAAA